MASKVDICNSAMRKIGAARISDFTENSKEAELCRDAYDIIRRRLLRSNSWNFALKRANLAETPGDPLNEWAHSFQLPTDCLKIVSTTNDPCRYVQEGRLILTNEGTIGIKYVSDAELVNEFDPSFFEVLAFELAMDLCVPLTDSTTKLEVVQKMYAKFSGEALTNDAQDDVEQSYISDDTWLKSRGVGYAEV